MVNTGIHTKFKVQTRKVFLFPVLHDPICGCNLPCPRPLTNRGDCEREWKREGKGGGGGDFCPRSILNVHLLAFWQCLCHLLAVNTECKVHPECHASQSFYFACTPDFPSFRNYKIDEGSAGVRNCIWAPDGCSVLVVADFQIRISVHSLVDQSVKLMRGPKYADRAISFSPDGQLLAYAEVSAYKS